MNSSCKLSKMQACICPITWVNSCVWHTVSHTCILFKLLYFVYSIQYCTWVQYLYCKPRMSSMTRKKSYYPDMTGSFFQEGWYPSVRKIPWSRKWQPTPVSLPEKLHGHRSLVGYTPWSCRVGHGYDWAHHSTDTHHTGTHTQHTHIQQGWEPMPSTSGMSEISAYPPSPIADDASHLPSPTSSPSFGQ